jgi:hypothetical protein
VLLAGVSRETLGKPAELRARAKRLREATGLDLAPTLARLGL